MSLFKFIEAILLKCFIEIGLKPSYYEFVTVIVMFSILVIGGWLADFIMQKIIITTVTQLSKKTETLWDDILVEKKVFHRIASLAPALLFYFAAPYAYYKYIDAAHVIQILSKSFIIFIFARVIDAFLNASHSIYELNPYSKQKPIKGYIQVGKIIVYFICILVILSIVFNKSLVYFFSGLGALAAVLLLIFKDTILGLVASVQISSNNMVKIGDWITFSKYNADGNVIELSLNTVKVQNFDKTIVSIPIYALISESFQNWRGMEESDGRRFKRLLLFDTRSVHFCDEQFIEKLKNEPILHTFLHQHKEDTDNQITQSSRLLHTTNMGIYRKYAEYILHNHSKINQELSHFVRHGQMSENGISLEIYSFTRDKAGIPYEQIQAELVEHLIAIATTFELTIFQKPSGNDMRSQ
jgi:miniconductance mechanosensitive channel